MRARSIGIGVPLLLVILSGVYFVWGWPATVHSAADPQAVSRPRLVPLARPAEPALALASDAQPGAWQCDPVGGPACFRWLSSVSMVSPSEGWAVGAEGTILHYSSGIWQAATSPVTTSLSSVSMVSPSEGWAVGGDTILHYTGGAWEAVAHPAANPLTFVTMLSATEGWAVGAQTALHYTLGSWQEVPVSVAPFCGLTSVSMSSPSEGWATGDCGYKGALILHYSGGSWQTGSAPFSLESVSMVSSSDGWAVGDGILHYTGGAWQRITSPANVGLSSVAMASVSEGWAVGSIWLNAPPYQSQGIILHYVGGSWQTVTSPTTHELYSAVMAPPYGGWVVGSQSTILHYAFAAGPTPTPGPNLAQKSYLPLIWNDSLGCY